MDLQRKGRLAAALILGLFLAGCGGNRALVQTQPGEPTPLPTPTVPLAPGLSQPVADADYQQALTQTGGATVTARNLGAYYTVAQYLADHGDWPGTLRTAQKILSDMGSASALDRAQYLVGLAYFEMKDNLPALSAFQNVLQAYPGSAYADPSRRLMEFMVQYSLSLDELKRFEANYPGSPLKCTTLFQLGSRESQAGDVPDAVQDLTTFLQQCPQDPSAPSAQLLLQTLRDQQQGKVWRLGVLAPLTGRFKEFGQSFVNGVNLAFDQAGSGHKMTLGPVQDTGGDSLQAVKLFQQMVQTGAVDAVLGPVVKPEIDAVAPLANQQGIPLMAATYPVDGLSALGPYVLSDSMTNEMQGRAMARFAVQRLGLKRFGILYPDDGYGQTLSQAFARTVEALGATVTAEDSYPPDATDFQKQISDLGGRNPESAKQNDRENQRRMGELEYDLGKEVQKFLFKAQQADPTSATAALVPLGEALANTNCPTLAPDVNNTLQAALQGSKGYTLRGADLVQQSLTLLPVEFRGTTLPVSADQWTQVASELQTSVIVTGRVLGTNPPDDATQPTWNYSIELEAFQADPKTGQVSKLAGDKLALSLYKPPSLLPTQTLFDALYLPSHSVEIPLIASQLHYYDLFPVLLGGHLWMNDSVLREGGKDVEGAYFVTGFFPDSTSGAAKDFVDAYVQRYAAKPDLVAAEAYDAARILIRAGDAANSRAGIRDQVLAIQGFDGAGGETSFNGKAEADKLVPVIQIKDGKFQQVQ